MKNCGESAPHAIIVCVCASELVTDIRLYGLHGILLVCAFLRTVRSSQPHCSRDELAAAEKKILELFEDHGAHNNICYQKKKELGTCTRIEIKGTCGTTEVITASMSC